MEIHKLTKQRPWDGELLPLYATQLPLAPEQWRFDHLSAPTKQPEAAARNRKWDHFTMGARRLSENVLHAFLNFGKFPFSCVQLENNYSNIKKIH